MALKDVKKYYNSMTVQLCELKADIADFQQAVADGYITEDKLKEVLEEAENMKANLDRLAYIMYLFELPKRPKKRNKYLKNNKDLTDYFEEMHADKLHVEEENRSVMKSVRENLIKLTENKKISN